MFLRNQHAKEEMTVLCARRKTPVISVRRELAADMRHVWEKLLRTTTPIWDAPNASNSALQPVLEDSLVSMDTAPVACNARMK